MNTSTSTPDIPPDLPAATPEVNPAGICREIDALQAELLKHGSLHEVEREDLSERLSELGGLLSERTYTKSSAIELHHSFHPPEIEHRLAAELEKNPIIAVLEVVRNVAVLVPIFLTWAALSTASRNYASALQSAPEPERTEMFELPFLLLWEQDFREYGSHHPLIGRPTFSQVATWDALIILAAGVLTLYFHLQTDVMLARSKRDAAKVRRRLDSILWKTSQLFSTAYMGQVSTSGEAESYGQLAEALTDGTEKLTVAAVKLGDASARLNAFKAIALIVQDQQTSLLETIKDLSYRVDQLGATAQSATFSAEHVAGTAKVLAGNNDRLLENFDKVVTNLKLVKEEKESFTDQMQEVSRSLNANASRTEEAFRGFTHDLGQRLQTSATEITETAAELRKNLDEVLGGAADKFAAKSKELDDEQREVLETYTAQFANASNKVGEKLEGVLNTSTTKINKTADTLGDNLGKVQKELGLLSSRGISLPQAQPRLVKWLVIIQGVQLAIILGSVGWLIYHTQIMGNTL